jgi:WD40 repeat protein
MRLFTGHDDGTVRQWDLATAQVRPRRARSVGEGEIQSVPVPQEVRVLTHHSGAVASLAISEDGSRVCSGGEDKTCVVWSADDGAVSRLPPVAGRCAAEPHAGAQAQLTLRRHTGPVLCVAVSRDGHSAFSGGEDKAVLHWKLSGAEVTRTHTCAHTTRSLASLSCVQAECVELAGHTEAVYAVALSHDQRFLFSASGDRTIRQWSLDTAAVQALRVSRR